MRGLRLSRWRQRLLVHALMLPQRPTIGAMPLPYWLTRFNLVISNRIIAPFAARLPGFVELTEISEV